MLFYYGNKDLDCLQTPEARGEKSRNNKQFGIFDGAKSLTFYTQKLPKNIVEITAGKFNHYRKHKVSTCYIVDPRDLPENIGFRFKWTRAAIDMFVRGQNRVAAIDNRDLHDMYNKEIFDLEKRLGLRGQGRDLLLETMARLSNDDITIKQAVIDLVKYDSLMPELKLFDKSNLLIPQVAIYMPDTTPIEYEEGFPVYFK